MRADGCEHGAQENALDPSHASYVHNLVISKRQDAAPMQMALSGEIDAQQGFILEHGGYSKSQQEGSMKAKRYFIPPCTIRFAFQRPSMHSALFRTELRARAHPWLPHSGVSPAGCWSTVLSRALIGCSLASLADAS